MAIAALSEWGREAWPPGAADALRRAIELEPDAEVHDRMEAVLEGRPLPDFATEGEWPDAPAEDLGDRET